MEIQETPEGLIVQVKVKPGSGGFRLTQQGENLVLELRSPPREGQANQEIMTELPKLLRCEVKILRGSRSSSKLLLLKGITREEIDLVLATR
jgi:uncharacterized protein (TIGR00251 family)